MVGGGIPFLDLTSWISIQARILIADVSGSCHELLNIGYISRFMQTIRSQENMSSSPLIAINGRGKVKQSHHRHPRYKNTTQTATYVPEMLDLEGKRMKNTTARLCEL
jgi:hypothetical protein